MTLKNKIKKVVTGLTIPQEYVCLETPDIQFPISVFLFLKNEIKLDVTSSHLFLGYKPLIIALHFKTNESDFGIVRDINQITLSFESLTTKGAIPLAKLTLEKFKEIVIGDEIILFCEGRHGAHLFLNYFHQGINRLREKLKRQVAGNVELRGNLIEQVRIAYSVPRAISMITLSDGNLMNMFPTDLHGPIGRGVYAGSLRLGGLANEQVEKYGRIVLSEVKTTFYREAYALGKNHMQELKEETEFKLHPVRSLNFNFPLPISVTRYQELNKIDDFDYGIHRVHLYEVIYHEQIQSGPSLSHIHQQYAQWRIDRKFFTPMMLR